jgi:hypothetical protein
MTTLNLTLSLERLVADVAGKVEEFGHIDPLRVMLCVSSTRSGGVHGVYAKIHPLRFAGGARSMEVKKGRRSALLTMPTVIHRQIEMLYVIYFLVPRFFNLPKRDKLVTVFHELYHISPLFDGDIRRFPGRNFAHGSSRKRYNVLMDELVEKYLSLPGCSEVTDFLDSDLESLRSRYLAIVGRKFPVPKVRIQR